MCQCVKKHVEMFVCFVDFEKAFDRVQWPKLLEILRNISVDWRDRRLIKNLYLKQTVTINKLAKNRSLEFLEEESDRGVLYHQYYSTSMQKQ